MNERIESFEVDVAEIPQIKRNKVWCTVCGREQSTEGMNCLRNGWPECCGYTMTIDSPEERAKLKEVEK